MYIDYILYSVHVYTYPTPTPTGLGRVSQSCPFSKLTSYYFLHQAPPIQLLPLATNQWLIRDKLGGAHLTSVNAASAMKDPQPLVCHMTSHDIT